MGKGNYLHIRCSEDLKSRLRALAAKEHRTLSNLVLKVLAEAAESSGSEMLREKETPYGEKKPTKYPPPKRGIKEN